MPLHPESAAYLTMVDEWRAENGYGTAVRIQECLGATDVKHVDRRL